MSLTCIVANAHEIFARSCDDQSVMLRMADDAIACRSGKSVKISFAKDQAVLTICYGLYSLIGGIDCDAIESSKGKSSLRSTANAQAELVKAWHAASEQRGREAADID